MTERILRDVFEMYHVVSFGGGSMGDNHERLDLFGVYPTAEQAIHDVNVENGNRYTDRWQVRSGDTEPRFYDLYGHYCMTFRQTYDDVIYQTHAELVTAEQKATQEARIERVNSASSKEIMSRFDPYLTHERIVRAVVETFGREFVQSILDAL